VNLNAYIGDDKHELRLDQKGRAVIANVAGRQYEIQVNDLLPGEGLILMDGPDVFECLIASHPDHRDSFEVHLRGKSRQIRIEDPKRLRSGEAAGAHDHGAARIAAPMPGKVVRVLVEVGQTVDAGVGLVVVEAMKMQNEMKSPKAGTVITLNAVAGATVNAGEVLAVIE
jgi:biotin carboxyl carrier protein